MDPSALGFATLTQSECPRYVCVQKPVFMSQSFIVLSLLADRTWSPDGIQHTLDTLWSCPCNVFTHSYVLKSHSLIVMSAEQDTSRVPSASNARHWTESRWPFRVLSKSPCSQSQTLMTVSSEPDTKTLKQETTKKIKSDSCSRRLSNYYSLWAVENVASFTIRQFDEK